MARRIRTVERATAAPKNREWFRTASDTSLAREIERAVGKSDWVPTPREIESLSPDDKRFLVEEAAQDLLFWKLPPPSVAVFVGDLVLARCSRKPIREAARAIQAGKAPDSAAARFIAAFLLKLGFRGRPPSASPKDLRIAITYYVRSRDAAPRARRSIVSAMAREFGYQKPSFVRKMLTKYRPFLSYLDGQPVDAVEPLLTMILAGQKRSGRRWFSSNASPSERARALLIDALACGSVPTTEILRRSRAAGISQRTLLRVKKSLRVHSRRAGTTWTWTLQPRMPNG
jgi:hypothetical protein